MSNISLHAYFFQTTLCWSCCWLSTGVGRWNCC